MTSAQPVMTGTLPRRFHLVRRSDPNGAQPARIVAEGAVWSSGAVALHWPGHPRATSVWSSLDDIRIAHEGESTIRFLDAETKAPDKRDRDERGWPKLTASLHDPRD